MPGPTPDWPLVPIAASYKDLQGRAINGTIKFTPRAARLKHQTDLTQFVGQAIWAEIDATGAVALDLPATDYNVVAPFEWTYFVEEQFEGGQTYDIVVPQGATLTGGINLKTWSRVEVEEGTHIAYVPLPGPGATITVGTVTTGAPGSSVLFTLVGTGPAYTLNVTIPRGDVGPSNNIGIGTVTTGAAGSSAVATVTGVYPNQVLNLTIPQGVQGPPGTGNVNSVNGDVGPNVVITLASLGGAPSNNPTLSGTVTLGTADTTVIKQRSAVIETDDRTVTYGYTGSNVTSVTETDGATTVKTTTYAYDAVTGRVTTMTVTAGGTTTTTTYNYDGSGNLTSTTRSVA